MSSFMQRIREGMEQKAAEFRLSQERQQQQQPQPASAAATATASPSFPSLLPPSSSSVHSPPDVISPSSTQVAHTLSIPPFLPSGAAVAAAAFPQPPRRRALLSLPPGSPQAEGRAAAASPSAASAPPVAGGSREQGFRSTSPSPVHTARASSRALSIGSGARASPSAAASAACFNAARGRSPADLSRSQRSSSLSMTASRRQRWEAQLGGLQQAQQPTGENAASASPMLVDSEDSASLRQQHSSDEESEGMETPAELFVPLSELPSTTPSPGSSAEAAAERDGTWQPMWRGEGEQAYSAAAAAAFSPFSPYTTGEQASATTSAMSSGMTGLAGPAASTPESSYLSSHASRSPSPSLAMSLIRRQQQREEGEYMQGEEDMESPVSVSPSQVWMSVYKPQKQAMIGVAYFSIEDETLYGGEYATLEAVQTLKYRLRPDVIVTTATHTEELYQQLAINELDPVRQFHVKSMKRHEFTLESAIQRLRLLQVEDLVMDARNKEMNKVEQTLLLRSAIDFEQTNMICSMGGLILHLLNAAVFSQLESERLSEPVSIRSIRPIPLGDLLEVDRGTMESLSLFVSETHPAGGRQKEGFSVFSVLNQTKTNHGSRMLRHWLMYPSTNIDTINQRQEHVEYFTRPANSVGSRHKGGTGLKDGLSDSAIVSFSQLFLALLVYSVQDLVGQLRSHLRHIKDMGRLVTRFQKGGLAKLADWKSLYVGLSHLLAVDQFVSDRVNDLPLFATLHSLLVSELHELAQGMEELIDLEQEEDDAGVVHVKAGVNDRLDDIRTTYAELDDLLASIAQEDRRELLSLRFLPRSILSEYHLVYLPQIGFLAKVPHADETSPANPLQGFDFKFKTDTHVFFKNATALQLDAKYGDMQGIITDTENGILRQLQEQVALMAEGIKEISNKVAELDVYLSLAHVAVVEHLVRPHLTSEPVLLIRDGRHLLAESKVESFTSNSTIMGTEKEQGDRQKQRAGGGKLHIITGPNNSGKTVYLKQVGLIVYLAHTGAFVPAAEATIGVCDRILTRIRSIDSVSSNFSTFTYDTSQMSYLLRHCTARSLCLVDEYGKGTASLDGIALLASVIRHLERLGANCPNTLVATHFHELFSLQVVQESALVTFWKMDFLEEDASSGTTPTSFGLSNSTPTNSTDRFTPSSSQGKSARQGDTSSNGDTTESSTPTAYKGQRLPRIICLSEHYKLVPGVSQRSFGTSCAIAAGVSESLMVRAVQVANQIAAGQPLEPIDLLPGSLPSSGATPSSPSSFSREEEDVWYEFLSFLLHGSITSLDDAHASAQSEEEAAGMRSQLKLAIQRGAVDVAQLLAGMEVSQVEELYRRFFQRQQGQNGHSQPVRGASTLETVD